MPGQLIPLRPTPPLPPTAMFSLRREIRLARRDVTLARTDGDRLRTLRRLEALRMTAHDLFTCAGTVSS